jgi:Arylamine N-acetyltransferase
MTTGTPTDRLTAYLARLNLDAAPTPDAHGLAILQAAQRRSIAFENLDVRLGRPILIDGDSVFEKLVTRQGELMQRRAKLESAIEQAEQSWMEATEALDGLEAA